MVMFNLPKKVYFKNGSTPVALRELSEVYRCSKALIVGDVELKKIGILASIGKLLSAQGIRTTEFFSLQGVPTFAQVQGGIAQMEEFAPDVIVGVGGGSAMSAAKALWALYENPQLQLEVAVSGQEPIVRGEKAKLVLVATSFGRGLQNSPFAVLKNAQGTLCALNSWNLLPEISVTDSFYVATLTPQQVEAAANKLLQQVEAALTSSSCTDYPHGLLAEAQALLKKELPFALKGCPVALEKLHHAAAIAGCALGNVLTTEEYIKNM